MDIKVLNVNKFFYIKGGSETYYFSLRDLLNQNGHEVIDFSMKHDLNNESPYEEYFVDHIDYNTRLNLYKKVKLSCKIIYSVEAKKKIGRLIRNYKPDIAHLNIFQHQLSPSILHELKKYNIPIVYTVHDLKSMCPNYKMLHDGKICEACRESKYYNCLLNKCVKESFLKSFVSTLEMYIHSWLKVYDLIDCFIVPSRFFMKKLIEYGFDSKKIIYNANFLNTSDYEPNYNHENYFVYLGRLSEEKGILTLIDAMQYVKGSAELRIVGTGPLENEIKQLIKRNKLDNRIEMVGHKRGLELSECIKNAMFGIMPSECYENAPYSVLEMMAYGKPVIGARTGGIPELIDDLRTGMTYEMGNSKDLSQKINGLLGNKDLMIEYGMNGRKKLETEFDASVHYEKLNHIYKSLVKQ